MPTSLSKAHRNLLAQVTQAARDRAEAAARAALEHVAVHEKSYRPHMSKEQQDLRNRLRARGRALGDKRDDSAGTQRLDRLVEAVAYEQWHRLLFTRFLAENQLLHTDDEHGTVPVTLAECEDLASELGERDGFSLACRFAARTLPGVFRRDDPVLELRLAPNDEVELRRLLDSLHAELFRADDALGWTYQFWQSKRKDEVNRSEAKIGAEELPAVTQLFTEDYMVEFLLDNTLGAWWAGNRGAVAANNEVDARSALALSARERVPAIDWSYLRLVQDEQTKTWAPASGTFDGWPKTAEGIRFLDPCMGSGHFLVFALPILVRLRMEEESLSASNAVTSVLTDNLFGLELDERCTQIAAFNVALTAWRLGGWQKLPQLHLACSGLAPNANEKTWVALAGKSERMQRGMAQLHALFKDAPVLGSLIDPRRATRGDLIEASFHELQPVLTRALNAETSSDDDRQELGVVAQGVAKAADILNANFTLVATNVPYLGRGRQDDVLRDYCENSHPAAKQDLATCFVERCTTLSESGSIALVTPQNWLFLKRYASMRRRVLTSTTISSVGRLGSGAFETIGGAVVNVALYIATSDTPPAAHKFMALSTESAVAAHGKAEQLRTGSLEWLSQKAQLSNPDCAISAGAIVGSAKLLEFASAYQGIGTSDNAQFLLSFWEIPALSQAWRTVQTAAERPGVVGGLHFVLPWEGGQGRYARHAQALKDEGRLGGWKSGAEAWGHRGIAINVTANLYANLYSGDMFDTTVGVVIPKSEKDLKAILAYVQSPSYAASVRMIDQGLSITEHTLLKVPFDRDHWHAVAQGSVNGQALPSATTDARQWVFAGHPMTADKPLQVAVARLLGYQWPRQSGSSFQDCPALGPDGLEVFADDDGIVCLPPLNREQPAAARLRALLATAFGPAWSASKERDLLTSEGSTKVSLEEWLRDEFFEQHTALFHDRPFIWHIWDGRKDGFHALVNYHRLDNASLQKLTYSYLGDWLRQQETDAKADKPGAAERLGAAQLLQQELANILKGEPEYDIFVRWKPLSKQSIGWNPDVNDGVRLNIRPFMRAKDVAKKGAGVLRAKPNIKWDKDRGKEPKKSKEEFPWFWSEEAPPQDYAGGRDFTGHRWNDVHYSINAKRGLKRTGRT